MCHLDDVSEQYTCHPLEIKNERDTVVRSKNEADSDRRHSFPLRYGVAVASIVLASSLRLLLDPLMTQPSPFLLLLGAVMIAAWFGGLGPGLVATVLGAISADYLFLAPVGSFTGHFGVGFLPMVLFVLQGLLITSLAHELHVARERAEASRLEVQSHQEKLAERGRELHDLVGRMIDTQEEERRRVAYEIHDGFTQMAAAAYRRLALFKEYHAPEAAQDRHELDDAIALVHQTVAEARRVIANLRPTTLDDFGLATALRMQVEELRSEGFDARYEETLGKERLPATLETTLLRVTQEALANMRKHAQTDRVRVQLGRHDGFVRLEVRYWGRGFEPAGVRQGGGPGEKVGLSSMRERIALLGGSLEIRSQPGAGTSVVAEVPLPVATSKEKGDDGE
jgi:signal transduction histidine kinase